MNNQNIKKAKQTKLSLLILSLILSALIAIGTGIILSYIWYNINATNEKNTSIFLNTQFVFIYTLSSAFIALLLYYVWSKIVTAKLNDIGTSEIDILPISLNDIPYKKIFKYCLIICVFAIIITFINNNIFNLPEITNWQKSLIISAQKTKGGIVLLFLSAVILAPIWEELVFRGILYTGFSLLLPKPISIILTATFWALAHSYQYNTIILFEIIIIGIIFGVSRYDSKSVKLPIILHVVNNLIAFANLYYYSNIV